jgi:DnaJ-class molecular chaperone
MINLRFDLGESAYYIGKKRETIGCELCDATGTLALANGNSLECPTCHGTGTIATNNIIPGDIVKFTVNLIQIQDSGVFYVQLDENGNGQHIVEDSAMLTEDEAYAYENAVRE